MHILELKNIKEVLNDYDVFLFDLWGVVWEGSKPYENVVDSVNHLISQNKQVGFITNAPRRTHTSFERIKSWGIKDFTADVVFTSGEVALDMIKDSKNSLNIDKPILYHLGDRNDDLLENIGFYVTKNLHEANVIIMTLTRNEGEDLDEFNELFKEIILLNIPIICANPDTIILNGSNKIYTPGYFAAKLLNYGAKVIYSGKPYAPIFEKAFKRFEDYPKNRMLMIGDTFETDILGANGVGIDSALVMTGNAIVLHQEHQEMQAKITALQEQALTTNMRPNFIITL